MRTIVVTAPVPEQVLQLDIAKKHLRVETDDDDELIQSYIAAAIGTIDGPAGWLGRSIGQQTLATYLDRFDPNAFAVPYGPVKSISLVQYLNGTGTLTALDPGTYEAQGDKLVTKFGSYWPSTAWRTEAVKVTYLAGYDTVPGPILSALKLMVGDLYENRETTIALSGAVVQVPMSATVDSLLAPFRVWSC